MQGRRNTTTYLLPVAFAVILVISLVLGVVFLRSSLMKLTIEERSNQLEEMVTQIQANLDSGLQTHWNLVAGLNNAAQGIISRTVRMCPTASRIWKMISVRICMDAG